jgi:hypothetical protein
MPLNDRMIYGAYEHMKRLITCGRRNDSFKLTKDRFKLELYVMHSERFLNASIFPAITIEASKQALL